MKIKIWNYLKEKNRWAIALVILLILISGSIIKLQRDRINNLNDDNQKKDKLYAALLDSVHYYKNKHDEVVAEKLTIQETVKNLEKIYGQLNDMQKELISRIKEVNKKNDIIAAALIQANFKIDSLVHSSVAGNNTVIDTTKKMVHFDNLLSLDTLFRYNIDVMNVLPAKLGFKPDLRFNSIYIPNKQFVEFHWKNDKKKGYPIAFSISNSNKYIQVSDIESYAIPPLDKLHLNPTGWQKIENFFIKNGRKVIYIGIGAAAGAGGYYILTH